MTSMSISGNTTNSLGVSGILRGGLPGPHSSHSPIPVSILGVWKVTAASER